MRDWLLGLVGLLFVLGGGAAQAADPSPELRQRSSELVALLNGGTAPDKLFSPVFLAQVPPEQVKAVGRQLTQSHGGAKGVVGIEAETPLSGTVSVDFERATVRMRMSLAAAPPHLVEGLLVTGVEAKGDSVAALFGEIVGLPGEVSLAAARLDGSAPQMFLTEKADRPLAVGSAFKLFILAELVREVKAGERHWSDVVTLDRRSLPSGFLQAWPKGSPITLHSLAALMISQSDNTATDNLLAMLGRERVERLLPALGVKAPERLRPFLSTREAFVLKLGAPALRARWAAASEAERRSLLAGEIARGDLESIDPKGLLATPVAIRDVEWFASPSDVVRTLDWLRRSGDSAALAILAINPGLPELRARFDYVGFKGGSESGVLNLSYLLRRKDGVWMAFSVSWNNAEAPVDEARLVAAVSRLLTLLSKD
jgi:hypothetical protein